MLGRRLIRTACDPTQCIGARAMLNWSPPQLAERSGVAVNTLRAFETGKVKTRPEAINALEACFRAAGVTFLPAAKPGWHPRPSRMVFEDGSAIEIEYGDRS